LECDNEQEDAIVRKTVLRVKSKGSVIGSGCTCMSSITKSLEKYPMEKVWGRVATAGRGGRKKERVCINLRTLIVPHNWVMAEVALGKVCT
jgi:hypothetical protein